MLFPSNRLRLIFVYPLLTNLPIDVKGNGVETGQIGEGKLLMALANLVTEFGPGKVKKVLTVLGFLQLEWFRIDLLPLSEIFLSLASLGVGN